MPNSLFQASGHIWQNLHNGTRIAFLIPLHAPLRISYGQIIALAFINVLAFSLVAIGYFGWDFSALIYTLSYALLTFPLLLVFVFALAYFFRYPSLLFIIPISFLSTGIALHLAHTLIWFGVKYFFASVSSERIHFILYCSLIFWWSLAALFFLFRYLISLKFKRGKIATLISQFIICISLFLLTISLPPATIFTIDFFLNIPEQNYQRNANSIDREESFHAQPALFKDALDGLAQERPGITDLYFVGFAAYANEDVFMKELRVIEPLFKQRFDTQDRSIVLINNPQTAMTTPVATRTNLAMAFHRLAKNMNVEEDIAFLYFTSHGSKQHELSVNFWPLKLNQITPASLKKIFDDAGIKWRVIVVSACYSGGYIEPLKDEHTLIMTASDATHTSFGCSNESDFTYFGKAMFDEELRKTYSFTEAFDKAKASILAREKADNFEPSNPQIFIGEKIAGKLKKLEMRLSQQTLPQTAGELRNEK
jgi:Peptidase C13 family